MTRAAERCDSCGAAVPASAPWCTQCFAPAGEKHWAPEPAPPVLPRQRAPDLVPPPAGEPAWPCLGCGAANGLQRAHCAACGAPFLAGAAEAPALVLPLVGDLAALGRGTRLGLAVLVVLLALLLTALAAA